MNLYLIALSTKYSDGWDTTFLREVFTDYTEAEQSIDWYASVFSSDAPDPFAKCLSVIDVAPVLMARVEEVYYVDEEQVPDTDCENGTDD